MVPSLDRTTRHPSRLSTIPLASLSRILVYHLLVYHLSLKVEYSMNIYIYIYDDTYSVLDSLSECCSVPKYSLSWYPWFTSIKLEHHGMIASDIAIVTKENIGTMIVIMAADISMTATKIVIGKTWSITMEKIDLSSHILKPTPMMFLLRMSPN